MERREIFLNIHIPKTGGSTFIGMLERNFGLNGFGKGFCDDRGLLDDYQQDARQIEKVLAAYPEITCYSTHRLSLDLPYYRDDWSLRPMTLIRDPVSRFTSHYFFHRHHTNMIPQTSEMGINEYTDWALAQGNQPMYISGQTRFLTGMIGPEAVRRVEEHIKDRQLLLLPLHRFDEVCVLLERSFPHRFRDCTYKITNVSKKDQTLDQEQLERIKAHVGSDVDLLAIADRQLDERLASLFHSEDDRASALKEFQERCHARTQAQVPLKGPSKARRQLMRLLDVSPLKVYRSIRRNADRIRIRARGSSGP